MTTAPEELRSYFARWQNLEQQKAEIADDLKELFSEAKGNGFEPKVMRAAFRIKAKLENETDDDRELAAKVETYLDALEPSRATRAHTREKIEESPRKAAEAVSERAAIAVATIATAAGATTPAPDSAQSAGEAGGYATSVLPTNSPETANEAPKQVYGDSVDWATALPSESVDIPAGGEQSLEIDGLTDACPAETHSPETATKQRVNVHPQHEDEAPQTGAGLGAGSVQATVQNACVTVRGTESGTVANFNRELKPLRPYCQRPGAEDCGGYGSRHCNSCEKRHSLEVAL